MVGEPKPKSVPIEGELIPKSDREIQVFRCAFTLVESSDSGRAPYLQFAH